MPKGVRYYVDTEGKFINFFAPITATELMTELHTLGKRIADYEIRTVFGATKEIRPLPDEPTKGRDKHEDYGR